MSGRRASGTGRRLSPDQRRAQLLDVGARMFEAGPYEDVLMDDVARTAGVSRALLYHYFPAKRDFFAAVFRRDSERLLEASPIGDDAPLGEQVLAGLDAHLDYFAAHRHNILTANRGALSGDPAVQAIIADQLIVLRDRMLDASGLTGHLRRTTSIGLQGWLALVRAVCVEWLEGADISRDEIQQLCLRALVGIVAGQIDL